MSIWSKIAAWYKEKNILVHDDHPTMPSFSIEDQSSPSAKIMRKIIKLITTHWVGTVTTIGVIVTIIGTFRPSNAPVPQPEKKQTSSEVKQDAQKPLTYTINNGGNSQQAIEDKTPQTEISNTQVTVKKQDLPPVPEIITPNEEERVVLPATTTKFFQGDIRVVVAANSVTPSGAFRTRGKLAGESGIKNIEGEVGDVFEFGRFREYKVSISELNGNYAVFNIKRRKLSSDETMKKAYPDLK